MASIQKLNQFEYYLLSSQQFGSEPLFWLYSHTLDHVQGANKENIAEALVNLVNLGYSVCNKIYVAKEKYVPCQTLTVKDLKNRFEGFTQEEMKRHPQYWEYYFSQTEKGKKEEMMETYKDYFGQYIK